MKRIAQATRLSALPVTLSHVRDIEWYDGPLMSEFVDGDGTPWVANWCDLDDTAHRWLVFSTTAKALDVYGCSDGDDACRAMRSMIADAGGGVVYLCDTDQHEGIATTAATWSLAPSELPEDYLPTVDG